MEGLGSGSQVQPSRIPVRTVTHFKECHTTFVKTDAGALELQDA